MANAASRQERIADALNFNLVLLRSTSVGLLVYQASGPCVSANEAAARILGLAKEQLLRQDFRQLESWKRSGLLAAAEATLAGWAERRKWVRGR